MASGDDASVEDTTLALRELRLLALEFDLPMSGAAEDLLARLREAGATDEELGLLGEGDALGATDEDVAEIDVVEIEDALLIDDEAPDEDETSPEDHDAEVDDPPIEAPSDGLETRVDALLRARGVLLDEGADDDDHAPAAPSALDAELAQPVPVASGDLMIGGEDDEPLAGRPASTEPSGGSDAPIDALDASDAPDSELTLEPEGSGGILDATLVDDEPGGPSGRAPRRRGATVPGSLAMFFSGEGRQTRVALLLAVLVIGGGLGTWWLLRYDAFVPREVHYGDSFAYEIAPDTNSHVRIEGKELIDAIIGEERNDDLGRCELIDVPLYGAGSLETVPGDATDFGGSVFAPPVGGPTHGSTPQRDGHGREHLTVERSSSLSVNVNIKADDCDLGVLEGPVGLTQTTWQELTLLRPVRSISRVITEFADVGKEDIPNSDAATVIFGGSGLWAAYEDLAPGLTVPFQPVDLHTLADGRALGPDVSGKHEGWNWTVRPQSERVEIGGSSVRAWVVDAYHVTVRQYSCLGHAEMVMYVTEDVPWPVLQTVDIDISTQSLDSCGNAVRLFLALSDDVMIPRGQLDIDLEFRQRGDFSPGSGQAIRTVLNYHDAPVDPSGIETPTHDWGKDGFHVPDNSTQRAFTLREAVACISTGGSEYGNAAQALGNMGYIFRAQDDRVHSPHRWNVSWIWNTGGEDLAGWVLIQATTAPGECALVRLDAYSSDDTPEFDRAGVPTTLSFDEIEARLLGGVLYPELAALISSNGAWIDEVRLGYRYYATGPLPFGLEDRLDGVVLLLGEASLPTDGGGTRTIAFSVDAEDGYLQAWRDVTIA